MSPIESLCGLIALIGEQRQSLNRLAPTDLYGSVEESTTNLDTTESRVNHHVFHPRGDTAFGCADGVKQVHHADHLSLDFSHKEGSEFGCRENRSQCYTLPLGIWFEVGFLREEELQEPHHGIEIVQTSRTHGELHVAQ